MIVLYLVLQFEGRADCKGKPLNFLCGVLVLLKVWSYNIWCVLNRLKSNISKKKKGGLGSTGGWGFQNQMRHQSSVVRMPPI
jgi:hypothetical protein